MLLLAVERVVLGLTQRLTIFYAACAPFLADYRSLIKCICLGLGLILLLGSYNVALCSQPCCSLFAFNYDSLTFKPSTRLSEVFQVSQPVIIHNGSSQSCNYKLTLMEHDFAFSYGKPFIGSYVPLTCNFTRVILEFAVTSQGRQFDRLGMMFLGDIEVFRTSTAEPTPEGIRWTYTKDLSDHLVLFQKPQKIIFELGNLIDRTYTASFKTTLTATLCNDPSVPTAADEILPISARRSSINSGSSFLVPETNATSELLLPRNLRRAVVAISACGQADEEFWFGNVPSSNRETFPSSAGPLFGYSPFREIQLLIDGSLAGVSWPFPVIFTGGVVPSLWRPIVGIDAFDLRENEIDITPWLPLLCDGSQHTFEIRVVGIDDDGRGHVSLSRRVGSSWIITGKILLWLDDSEWVTQGSMPSFLESDGVASSPNTDRLMQSLLYIDAGEDERQTGSFKPFVHSPQPSLSLSSQIGKDETGENVTLTYKVDASRELVISSMIKTSSGHRLVTWFQSLKFQNSGSFSHSGNVQVIEQKTEGHDSSAYGGAKYYSYPLFVNTSYAVDQNGEFSIDAALSRGLDLSFYPDHLHLIDPQSRRTSELSKLTATALVTSQNGTAHYWAVPATSRSFGFGSTEQIFKVSNLEVSPRPEPAINAGMKEVYFRHVHATNGTVIKDEERIDDNLSRSSESRSVLADDTWFTQVFKIFTVREILGRGPGLHHYPG